MDHALFLFLSVPDVLSDGRISILATYNAQTELSAVVEPGENEIEFTLDEMKKGPNGLRESSGYRLR
ncbi:hypothetical protein Pan97_36360 [Bremerella volcania]|uniref:Uncharacterized protein n=1 Tax=Bremerella volcania TaxID=2527984 RepID=A0A518CBN3_9BACT|nr:hypothetical protein Pan97_36360 [Bremerella volcania]